MQRSGKRQAVEERAVGVSIKDGTGQGSMFTDNNSMRHMMGIAVYQKVHIQFKPQQRIDRKINKVARSAEGQEKKLQEQMDFTRPQRMAYANKNGNTM